MDSNTFKRPAPVGINSGIQIKKPKTTATNIGGSSQMSWFNEFLSIPACKPALQNLTRKISTIEITPTGCHEVQGFTAETRPQIDLKYRSMAELYINELPKRFSAYHISLLKHRVQVPTSSPPSYPKALRKVTHKRTSGCNVGNEKQATWVASHLCHNRKCVNREHLRWEPSWFNRLRDNCPGGTTCVHRPDACIASHRGQSELIDWTSFAAGGEDDEVVEVEG